MLRWLTYGRYLGCADRVIARGQAGDRGARDGSRAPHAIPLMRGGSPAALLDAARSGRLSVRYPQHRANVAAVGRDWAMGRHHFDIGVVSVFVEFVI
ncbi:hypothetical protein A5760_06790 [Mycobacterium colombiense]|uniref:Uncharacterized protein n=1 Tax=Mycobacterium colombiense TaxID=339268 RepID=A0A1A0VR54_9MYCO|nr:hypothetical protein A5760_06790 [Mycobacterium colombiense]